MFQSWCLGLLNFGHHWHISLSVRGNWQKRSKTSCLSQLVFSVCQLNTNKIFFEFRVARLCFTQLNHKQISSIGFIKSQYLLWSFYKYLDFSNLFFCSHYLIFLMVKWQLFDLLVRKFDIIFVKNASIDGLIILRK